MQNTIRTVTEVARLVAAIAMATRAGILLYGTIRDEVGAALDELEDDAEPTARWPASGLGDAVRQMTRNLATVRMTGVDQTDEGGR